MNNQIYEDNYTNIVEPKYGNKRDVAKDEILTNNIMTTLLQKLNELI